LKTILFSRY